MTSVLNDFIQDTDKSNMLISFIQMGHLQSVRDRIKNIKSWEAAQDLNYKIHQFNAKLLSSSRRSLLCDLCSGHVISSSPASYF